MARLPVQDGDDGAWGTILNDFLLQTHAADGTLNDNVVHTDAVVDASVVTTKLSWSIQSSLTKADAALPAATAESDYLKKSDATQFIAGAGPYTSTVPDRPTTGAFVIWNGTTDPGANAEDGDFWIAP
jgi:hypothetical protein